MVIARCWGEVQHLGQVLQGQCSNYVILQSLSALRSLCRPYVSDSTSPTKTGTRTHATRGASCVKQVSAGSIMDLCSRENTESSTAAHPGSALRSTNQIHTAEIFFTWYSCLLVNLTISPTLTPVSPCCYSPKQGNGRRVHCRKSTQLIDRFHTQQGTQRSPTSPGSSRPTEKQKRTPYSPVFGHSQTQDSPQLKAVFWVALFTLVQRWVPSHVLDTPLPLRRQWGQKLRFVRGWTR